MYLHFRNYITVTAHRTYIFTNVFPVPLYKFRCRTPRAYHKPYAKLKFECDNKKSQNEEEKEDYGRSRCSNGIPSTAQTQCCSIPREKCAKSTAVFWQADIVVSKTTILERATSKA